MIRSRSTPEGDIPPCTQNEMAAILGIPSNKIQNDVDNANEELASVMSKYSADDF